MSSVHRWLFLVPAAFALGTPVSAQWKPVADALQVQAVSPALPTTSAPDHASMIGSEKAAAETTAPTYIAPPLPGIERSGPDVALMVVGGAALVVGSLIGDDAGTLMMVGGGVLGLLGLYRYVR